MRFPRSTGILLHLTSLPGPYGIGDLGSSAFRFVDFLASAGQSIWQILPLGPPARGGSPYSCYSAFAGNPLLISPERLVASGAIEPQHAAAAELSTVTTAQMVSFPDVRDRKFTMLREAYDRFRAGQTPLDAGDFERFCHSHASWLDDYARYDAFMRHFNEPDWCRWDEGLVCRAPDSLAHWDERLATEIDFTKFVQFLFHDQWTQLRSYANEHGVRIFGDMPIFVAHESADAWSNQDIFQLTAMGRPRVVAGVPPDYFCATGQLWGNPLYDWDYLKQTDYDWWVRRFAKEFAACDILRIDHFRGFESYWEIPADAETAINGQWQAGPGADLFRSVAERLGELAIVAEDLGLITDAVHELRDELGFPGMRVIQFGYDDENDPYHRPPAYPAHCVAYTGTHDNDTLVGWYESQLARDPENHLLRELVPNPEAPMHWQAIQHLLESAADTTMVPLQDVFGLGSDARMNRPGEADGNWTWRFTAEQLTDDLSRRLRDLTTTTGRLQ
ncbi:MAG: 4-alpha-glucanotransferase [Planctomycetales bacterium]|nr:4-alpha-glucanotransferase [Planctomycetales bacterium]